MIRAFSQAIALQSHRQTLIVHHREHIGQTVIELTDQPSLGVVKIHDAGGRAFNAHLVFDRAAFHVIGLAGQIAASAYLIFRHQKQRDTFWASGCVWKLGQHKVDDIFSQVMLAGSDEYFGASQAVAAITIFHCPRPDHAEIGARMGLGETHSAGPLSRIHFW